MSVLTCSKPTRENPRLYVLLGGKLLSKDSFPKKLADELKMVSFFLMKRVSSRKDGMFSFGKGMFPSQKGCRMEIIFTAACERKSYASFYYHRLQFTAPTKFPNRTQGKILFQARAASALFFFSPCPFLSIPNERGGSVHRSYQGERRG